MRDQCKTGKPSFLAAQVKAQAGQLMRRRARLRFASLDA
jgi:hypothetical protein